MSKRTTNTSNDAKVVETVDSSNGGSKRRSSFSISRIDKGRKRSGKFLHLLCGSFRGVSICGVEEQVEMQQNEVLIIRLQDLCECDALLDISKTLHSIAEGILTLVTSRIRTS